VLAAAGIVIGGAGALAVTRVLTNFLFEVKPNDPQIFVLVALTLAIAAVLACYIPARRAMRVDPMAALRHG
jgi:putative ABC transport system permease protein